MPYIEPSRRVLLRPVTSPASDAGGLNFQITSIIHEYWQNREHYQAINDILGALEGAKLEFYLRIAKPYEERKCRDNGDID